MKFCLMLLLLTALICKASATTTKYPNGCMLTKSENNDTYRFTFEMPHPFLNCSHLGKSSFNLSGFPKDIASISLAYNDLQTFDPANISVFKELKKLDLRRNKLCTLNSANITAESVHDIYLGSNNLTKVPREFFNSFPSLYTLDLAGNRISAIADDDFANFRNLEVLILTSNPIEDISDVAFRSISNSLMTLALSSTGLREVPGFLSTMPKIIFLSLSNNEISNIRANAFEGSTNLEFLELASNKISKIDGRAFAGMNKLRMLDLTDNRIESLQAGVFDSVVEGEEFTIAMYENPLRCNCSLRWLKLWTDSRVLEDVRYKCMQPSRNHRKKSYELVASDFTCDANEDWIDDCKKSSSEQIGRTTPGPSTGDEERESTLCPKSCKCYDSKGVQYYPDGSPASTPSVGRRRLWYLRDATFPHVDCSNTSSAKLPKNIRQDVKSLSMERNPLETISIDDLKTYSSLAMLNLEGCRLREIVPSNSGVVFQHLTTLLLQRNELTSLGRDVLRSFPNVKTLMLYHNKIAAFPTDMFSSNKFLSRLYIGSNPVQNFDPRCLEDLQLYSLSLRTMNLTQIPVIKSKNMNSLDLSDNNITVIPNNTFADTPALFRLIVDNNRVSVIEPAAFNKTSKLRYLDLSENKLTRLPRGVFDDLEEDRVHIEMWMNRMYCDCNLKWFKTWIEKLEAVDPMTEVRFMCFRPWRLHGKTSDKLQPSDFHCEESDEESTLNKGRGKAEDDYYIYEHGKCYGGGSVAAAVILTFILTLLMVLLARWCFVRRRKFYSQYRAHDDAQLDADM